MHNRRSSVRLFTICCFLAGILLFAPSDSAPQAIELKPNLQAFAAFDLALVPNFQGGTKLIFSATTWNSGDGPLELIAGETSSAGQNVYQRVYFNDGSFDNHLAGIFVWHPTHNHFHFADYALYTLQPVNALGGSRRESSKTTFCIIDTTKVDTRLPGAPRRPVYVSCGPNVQGMSVGWGDTYDSTLAGQNIDFTGNPSGDYKLIIEVDPRKRLLETNEGDNIACALIRVNVSNATVQVLDDTGCDSPSGDVVVSDIEPESMQAGSSVPVTITGEGFASGMKVTFENGSGPRPTASDVIVQDANTIKATVTVKSGGPASERIWDVRVGSAVVVDGFTVQP
jgi:hypothetical protein